MEIQQVRLQKLQQWLQAECIPALRDMNDSDVLVLDIQMPRALDGRPQVFLRLEWVNGEDRTAGNVNFVPARLDKLTQKRYLAKIPGDDVKTLLGAGSGPDLNLQMDWLCTVSRAQRSTLSTLWVNAQFIDGAPLGGLAANTDHMTYKSACQGYILRGNGGGRTELWATHAVFIKLEPS